MLHYNWIILMGDSLHFMAEVAEILYFGVRLITKTFCAAKGWPQRAGFFNQFEILF